MNKLVSAIGAGALLLALGACAAGSVDAHATAASGDIPQFLLGLWHGLIAPFTLILEIIDRFLPHLLPWRVRMFESGAGIAYDVGFFLTVTSGSHFVLYSRRRWR